VRVRTGRTGAGDDDVDCRLSPCTGVNWCLFSELAAGQEIEQEFDPT
jgi:hypothetical protein